jgi:hypothetical protein
MKAFSSTPALPCTMHLHLSEEEVQCKCNPKGCPLARCQQDASAVQVLQCKLPMDRTLWGGSHDEPGWGGRFQNVLADKRRALASFFRASANRISYIRSKIAAEQGLLGA